ncbi:stAR-related lipid transfer protein 7, mitochondrial [Cephus cinctus]|uniref:Phosphatidylcholine transfer protein n=1 Tax=Cephus cinctus TaxID=211228 RepID=A0AAJ7BRC0_CEPCN|nr:stAR-related lipid transfer protein 7, mitochondrial [Cephus cinctus]
MHCWHVSGILSRRFNSNLINNSTARNALCNRHSRAYGKWGGHGRRIGIWFREQGIQVARACAKQFEFIAAQRVRRSMQIFHLYTKIWDEVALREFIKSWRCRVGRNAKEFLVSAVGVSIYNWDRERISDEEMYSYSKEIDGIYKLRESTVTCNNCHQRLVIDVTQTGIEYCKCHGAKAAIANCQNEEEWQPFIERQDMLVWRKEEPGTGGLYAYKVYGSFSDVSAHDFLQVQIDVEYRKQWDHTARQLEIIDTDPSSNSTSNSSSDIMYWEMIWPSLFANRDYVYQRRWLLNKNQGLIIIVSKGTDHPKAPKRTDTHRVTSYWSYMVIRPYKDFDEPGIEFCLTYFDDPGIHIPSAVTAWVSMSGLPNFLCRMRQAARDYHKNKAELGKNTLVPKEESSSGDENIPNRVYDVDGVTSPSSIKKENQSEKVDKENETEAADVTTKDEVDNNENENKEKEKEEESEKIENQEHIPEDYGFLHYFFLTKLFA